MTTKGNSEETLGQSIFIERKYILVRFYIRADYGWLTTDTGDTFDTFCTHWNSYDRLLNNKKIILITNADTLYSIAMKKYANTINILF